MSVALHPLSASSAPELKAGALLRSPSGEMYNVEGFCSELVTDEGMVLIRSLSEDNGALRVVARKDIESPTASASVEFSILPVPAEGPLLEYWAKHYPTEFKGYEVLCAFYAEPWRKVHTSRHLYKLFSLAKNLGIVLSREAGLALALHRVTVTPGAPAQVQLEQAVMVSKTFIASLRGPAVDWGQVIRHWDEGHKSSIRDLLLSPLAADALEFCATEELGWLEQRPMFRGVDGRKTYETLRLKELIDLAASGPIFSTFGDSFEKRARVNIEGMRQAWRRKYS